MFETVKIDAVNYKPLIKDWEYVYCPYCGKAQKIEMRKEDLTIDGERKRYHCDYCNRIFEIELKIEKEYYIKPIDQTKAKYIFDNVKREILYDLNNTSLKPYKE